MKQIGTRLVYFSSNVIVDFVRRNPIKWHTLEKAKMGDVLTPSPAIGVFFELLTQKGKLFTQREYVAYAGELWRDWVDELDADVRHGVSVRLQRNFYPSAIDSLHVWSLLVETGEFAHCRLDTIEDSVGKTDITVFGYNRKPAKLALRIGTRESIRRAEHKRRFRGECNDAIDLLLPTSRERNPGNKRWYTREDMQPVLDHVTGGHIQLRRTEATIA